jgi:NAD-dependent dihydropyrimidine dehydrogenase PreA subunit
MLLVISSSKNIIPDILKQKEGILAKEKILALPNITTPNRPVIFDPDICNGCNRCVEVCSLDVFLPNPVKGRSPIILHPDECWYCGSCVNECQRAGAIAFNWPLQQRGYWKRKSTGEIFRA